jgi:hypothetical protein
VIPVKPVTVREGRGHSSALSDQSLELPGEWDKVTKVQNTSRFLLPSGTAFVERDVLGVAEEVERISGGKCRVASCSCGKCLEKGHYPHVVLELSRRGQTSPVFGFTNFGPHVVQRLREIHVSTGHHKESLKKNEKIRKDMKAKAVEVQRENLEIVETALKSHKFDWRGPRGLRTRV